MFVELAIWLGMTVPFYYLLYQPRKHPPGPTISGSWDEENSVDDLIDSIWSAYVADPPVRRKPQQPVSSVGTRISTIMQLRWTPPKEPWGELETPKYEEKCLTSHENTNYYKQYKRTT